MWQPPQFADPAAADTEGLNRGVRLLGSEHEQVSGELQSPARIIRLEGSRRAVAKFLAAAGERYQKLIANLRKRVIGALIYDAGIKSVDQGTAMLRREQIKLFDFGSERCDRIVGGVLSRVRQR